MKKSTLILILNMLLLFGCTIGDVPDDDPNASNQIENNDPDGTTIDPTENNDGASNLLDTPDVVVPPPVNTVTPGLIPSVNPDARARRVTTGKNDPFNLVKVKPVINYPPVVPVVDANGNPITTSGSRSGGLANRGGAGFVGRGNIGSGGRGNIGSGGRGNIGSGGRGNAGSGFTGGGGLGNNADAATNAVDTRKIVDPDYDPKSNESKYCNKSNGEEVIQANEARAVLVSGVIDVEGRNLAIIKTPEHNYSYTVGEGATISDGKVFVKKIDVTRDSPSVVLEQYGKEIIRRLGQQPQAFTIAPLGSDGFGRIRNLILLSVEPQELDNSSVPIVEGIFCNDNDETIRVSSIDLQVEDKQSKEIISSLTVSLGTPYTLKPGQKGVFDGTIGGEGQRQGGDQLLGLRGKDKGELNFVMVGWR